MKKSKYTASQIIGMPKDVVKMSTGAAPARTQANNSSTDPYMILLDYYYRSKSRKEYALRAPLIVNRKGEQIEVT